MSTPEAATDLMTVVSPARNEADGIEAFHQRLVAAVAEIPEASWEFIYVDDGSTDATFAKLSDIAAGDDRVRVLRLSRNFGHQLAITCGLDHSNGDAVVVIDSDLQDPPEIIAEMVVLWRGGADVAYGQRRHRSGETWFKRASASTYYRLISRLSEVDIPEQVGDFRLMDRLVVDGLKGMREENRYIRGMISWTGFDQRPVYYDRDARHAGKSSYSLMKMINLAVNGITSFTEKPLRIASFVGAAIFAATVLLAAYILLGKLLDPTGSDPGFATITLLIMFFGSVQLLSIGLLGEYVGRIYRESKSRPLYLVRADVTRQNTGS